jgi:hypothetical protein
VSTADPYLQLAADAGADVRGCPLCGARPALWQLTAKDDTASKVVMCTSGDAHARLGDDLDGCIFFMPPNRFYRPTRREAIGAWNEYAEACVASRIDAWKALA